MQTTLSPPPARTGRKPMNDVAPVQPLLMNLKDADTGSLYVINAGMYHHYT